MKNPSDANTDAQFGQFGTETHDMLRSAPSTIRRHIAVALIGLSLLAGCSVQPTVETERSDAISVMDELPGIADPDPDPVAASVEEPPPVQIPALPDAETTRAVKSLLVDPDRLGAPWETTGDIEFKAGSTDVVYRTDCWAASRVMDLDRFEHGAITWTLNDGTAQMRSVVYVTSDPGAASRASADIEHLADFCPSYRGITDATHEVAPLLVDRPDVASTAVDLGSGSSTWIAGRRSGRFLTVIELRGFVDDDGQRAENRVAFDTLVDDVVRRTPQTATPVDLALSNAMLDAEDFGPGWSSGRVDLAIFAERIGHFSTVDPDVCRLDAVGLLVDHMRFVTESQTDDNTLRSEQHIAVLPSETDANDTVARIIGVGECGNAEVHPGLATSYSRVDIAGTDIAIDMSVNIDDSTTRYLIVRVDATISMVWFSDDGVLPEGQVVQIIETAAARLVAATS